MKKINLRLTKKDRIIRAENDTHKYITNSYWLIKYSKKYSEADLFTKGTNNKLAEYKAKTEKIDVDTVQKLIDNVINNNSKEPLQDTRHYEKNGRTNNFLKIFYSDTGGYQYFNNDFINLLSDCLSNFKIYHLSNNLRPVVFKHRTRDIMFLITPMRVSGDGGGFTLEKKQP